MKRNTQLAELKTPVKHNTLHKVTALGTLGRKMVVNRTKQSLRIMWVKTTHCPCFLPLCFAFVYSYQKDVQSIIYLMLMISFNDTLDYVFIY